MGIFTYICTDQMINELINTYTADESMINITLDAAHMPVWSIA